MHILPCGRYMTVMTCCPGAMVPAGMIGEHRMHSLGRAAADMHAFWDSSAAIGLGLAVPPEGPGLAVVSQGDGTHLGGQLECSS
ncbi:hypothetical protein RE628_28245 [Paenibacillus sp. D2_2]|uniref:hypothetical protein n=1 Tax=Paenibacillus sp. D2_2 TaxID=3073092 RepID=UPI002815A1D9|nr:hypothetical protein [Paenibacillus sp. D2_2]WMT40918.1 hypothetical protein RE628_28245 [Paenibacillus sp. D2_2]